MKLTDKKLQQAALLLLNDEVASMPLDEDIPDYPVSSNIEELVNKLISQIETHTLPREKIHMGWQYYTRKGMSIAAIILLLLCATMPEAVIAGCRKVIEVIETITEEYTLFQYTTTDEVEVFEPIKIVLPEEFVLKREIISEESAHWTYAYEDNYFIIVQNLITSDETAIVIDSEDAIKELLFINSDEILLYVEDDVCRFVWTSGKYQLHGHSNLDQKTLTEILKSIQYD